MQNLNKWQCGHCGLVIDLPDYDTECDQHMDALVRIGEHRWVHLAGALTHGSDDDLLGLCEDEPTHGSFDFGPADLAREIVDGAVEKMRGSPPTQPVDSDDVTSVLEGITELLRADLPRARRLWYPINEDGGFNR